MGKRAKLSGEEWQTYKRLMRYAYPYRRRLAIGVVFGVLFGGSTAGMVFALQKNFNDFVVWEILPVSI